MKTKHSIQENIYSLYYDKVFGYVLNRVHSRADAEDIASEVFLKIFSKADEFNPERAGASTYIFRVMQTTLADFYRNTGIVYALPEELIYEYDASEDLDELLESLNEALNILPKRELAVVVLHYYHGLSHKEIAEKMRLSYVNVRQLCHIALKKLRKEMGKQYERNNAEKSRSPAE